MWPMDAPGTETTFRCSLTVGVAPERAFRAFTQGMGSWWPASHHIAAAPFVDVVVEPRVGGRWYEVAEDGSECRWGTVLTWAPPRHLALSWHLDADFAYDADPARSSRVDIHFTPAGEGATLVELAHSGLERHGDRWQALRAALGSPDGWPGILRAFGVAAG
jgi:uncharacterized protein YndB with AHSA1/START domain